MRLTSSLSIASADLSSAPMAIIAAVVCDSSSATARADSVPCPPLSFGRMGSACSYIANSRLRVPARFRASSASLVLFCAAGSEPALASPFSLLAASRAASGDKDAGLPRTIDLEAKRLPVSGSTPRGLYSKRHDMEELFTTSARPRHSASLMMVRWAGARLFHAASIAARVIFSGPSLVTTCAVIAIISQLGRT